MYYDWPGNARELENAIERALILEDGATLFPRNFPGIKAKRTPRFLPISQNDYHLEAIEKHHIMMVLNETKGHKGNAASLLGIDRKTLYAKIKKYELG
jgi:DNA-binding NtrC family response regulator